MSYIAYLIFQISTDKPLIQLTNEYLDKLGIPDIEICCSLSDIQITKCVFNLDDWTSIEYDNCTKYIQRSCVEYNIYCYLFETNYTDFFGNPDPNINVMGPWVRNIDFYFQINNITNVTSRFLSVGAISVQLIDPEFNPLWKGKAETSVDLYVTQILKLQMNAFSGIQNMSTLAYFTKQTIQTILPHDISAILGVTPNYHKVSYLNVISKYFPMHPNDNVSDGIFDGHFSVAPGSFIHDVQSEKLSHTVLIALGVLGGGFVESISYFLDDQEIILENNGYRNIDLSNMPFVSKTNSIIEDHIPTEKKVIRLENRILALEKILEDYVINPYALRFLKLTPKEPDKN
ncbi:4902_t:CDS:2 [Cetraspora pellucida]|uniref:4902_t:CDS:1 n=1 Tax=Cetraspora pellucida TaxID=1433469 RepID=A0A9N9F1J9_9GLOM|nr:4902_t:CDS:2 [Cetraspora pellucida]